MRSWRRLWPEARAKGGALAARKHSGRDVRAFRAKGGAGPDGNGSLVLV